MESFNPQKETLSSAKLSVLDDCEAWIPLALLEDGGGNSRIGFAPFWDLNHCKRPSEVKSWFMLYKIGSSRNLAKKLVAGLVRDFPLLFKTRWFRSRVVTLAPCRLISVTPICASRVTNWTRTDRAGCKCSKHHTISTKQDIHNKELCQYWKQWRKRFWQIKSQLFKNT